MAYLREGRVLYQGLCAVDSPELGGAVALKTFLRSWLLDCLYYGAIQICFNW